MLLRRDLIEVVRVAAAVVIESKRRELYQPFVINTHRSRTASDRWSGR
jgi:hypothetical protein